MLIAVKNINLQLTASRHSWYDIQGYIPEVNIQYQDGWIQKSVKFKCEYYLWTSITMTIFIIKPNAPHMKPNVGKHPQSGRDYEESPEQMWVCHNLWFITLSRETFGNWHLLEYIHPICTYKRDNTCVRPVRKFVRSFFVTLHFKNHW